VREFLEQGNKVKVTVMFRGREMAHPEFGKEILHKVIEATNDITAGDASADNLPIEGRNMSVVLSPSKTIMKQLASKAASALQASTSAAPQGPPAAPEQAEE